MSRKTRVVALSAVVFTCVSASWSLAAKPITTKPRVLRLEYAAEPDRATLRLRVGDPDGQVLGLRVAGAIAATTVGRGCGPRNGRPADWVLPVRRLEPGRHALQVYLTSSTCTSKASTEESRSDFTITITRDGRVTFAGNFGDPFAPPRCRVGQELPASPIREEERLGIRRASPPIVIGCGRLRHSGRRFQLVGYQQTVTGGGTQLCIDTYLPGTRGGFGCGTNRVLRGGRVDITAITSSGRLGPMLVSGATTAGVARVTIRFRHRGRAMTRTATLVRVRDRRLLARVMVRRAFGRYLVVVPRRAQRLRVRAYDKRGGLLGIASAPRRLGGSRG